MGAYPGLGKKIGTLRSSQLVNGPGWTEPPSPWIPHCQKITHFKTPLVHLPSIYTSSKGTVPRASGMSLHQHYKATRRGSTPGVCRIKWGTQLSWSGSVRQINSRQMHQVCSSHGRMCKKMILHKNSLQTSFWDMGFLLNSFIPTWNATPGLWVMDL